MRREKFVTSVSNSWQIDRFLLFTHFFFYISNPLYLPVNTTQRIHLTNIFQLFVPYLPTVQWLYLATRKTGPVLSKQGSEENIFYIIKPKSDPVLILLYRIILNNNSFPLVAQTYITVNGNPNTQFVLPVIR